MSKKQGCIPIILGTAGLGLIRSLGEQGIKSLVVDDGPVTYRDHSKYCRRLFVPEFSVDPDEVIRCLESLGATASELSGQPPVLFPVSDHALEFITAHFEKLRKLATLGCGPLEAVKITLNKVKFYTWLALNGFPGPKTEPALLPGRVSGENRKTEVGFPCILKPEYTYRLEGVSGKKVYVASDQNELKRLYKDMEKSNMDFVVQEIIPGPIEEQFALAGYSSDGGEIECYVMTNKLRQSEYGAGSFVKSAYVPEILETGRRMLKRLAYRGIFEIEFKRDARDGAFKIIEFNPRCWSQIMLATRANVNVAHRAYLDLSNGSGKRVAFKASRKSKFWINFERDLGHVKRKIASGDFSLLGVLKVLVTLPCVEPFDSRDLKPTLFYVRKKFAQRIGLGNADH